MLFLGMLFRQNKFRINIIIFPVLWYTDLEIYFICRSWCDRSLLFIPSLYGYLQKAVADKRSALKCLFHVWYFEALQISWCKGVLLSLKSYTTSQPIIGGLEGKLVLTALQDLARARLREYSKNLNFNKFKEIKRKQKARLKLEAQKIINKNIDSATEGKGMKWILDAKRLSTRPGEDVTSTFQLPGHIDRNLTTK